MARDIYFYRRHYLKPATIRALIILIYIDRFILLEDLQIIKATEEAEETGLSKESENEEILEIREIEGLISDNEDSDDDDGSKQDNREARPLTGYDINSDTIATRLQLNEDDELNKNNLEFTEVTLPASAPVRLSQARPLRL
jgi:hypothetical protein